MRPLLSIGIIFKNEIRCLERCVKSLRPLRDAVPCELVMADTGSNDGSREIARQYADVFFDFPWINDFAAARNALIDHCSGEWFLTIDADEWLGDVSQLVDFLTCHEAEEQNYCAVIVRNYFEEELNEEYNDFLTVRLVKLSTGARYAGEIHEHWDRTGTIFGLGKTILHHDGYLDSVKKQGGKKDRNMKPLLEELAQNPENMGILLQCIESGQGDSSYEQYIRQGAAAVEKKLENWEYYGPPILRYAVHWASSRKLPELERWRSEMLEWFPDSIYTNIDVAGVLFADLAEKGEYSQAIPMGERYLHALEDYRKGQFDYRDLIFSTLVMSSHYREDGVRVILADQYFQNKQLKEARDMLLSIDRTQIRSGIIKDYMGILMNLHAQSGEDLSWVIVDLWEKIDHAKKREDLRMNMLRASAIAFSTEYREGETESGFTHAYTMFLPLVGKCGLGAAAAILESDDCEEMDRLLKTVDDWEELPIVALEQALLAGVEFPDRPLTLEEMDTLASRLAQSGEHLPEILDGAVRSMGNSPQALFWARGLALAAVSTNKWEDKAEGLHLAKTFAEVEKAVLPRYYAADMLQSELIGLLPPLHRFGWYCVQAFDALEAGKKADYVRLLREGLTSYSGMKPMVECLLNQLEEEQVQALPELLRLADQIRILLAQYPANDPAVVALKQSEAYQKVAHLIEEPKLDIFGGLAQ